MDFIDPKLENSNDRGTFISQHPTDVVMYLCIGECAADCSAQSSATALFQGTLYSALITGTLERSMDPNIPTLRLQERH